MNYRQDNWVDLQVVIRRSRRAVLGTLPSGEEGWETGIRTEIVTLYVQSASSVQCIVT